MKGITDIQLELRDLSNHLLSLCNDVEELKPKQNQDIEEMYKKVERNAKKNVLYNKELSKASDITKKLYFQFLISLMSKGNGDLEKLEYILRIYFGSTNDSEYIKEILKSRVIIDENLIYHLEENIGVLVGTLILDSLIVININGHASKEDFEYIADTSEILGCSKEDISVLSQLAKSIIQDDFNIFNKIFSYDVDKWRGMFNYIIPDEWLVKSRVSFGEYKCNKRV